MSKKFYESMTKGNGEEKKEEPTLKEKVDFLLEEKAKKQYPDKKFRLPIKGKVSNLKRKQGYVGVITLHDNRSIEFSKKPIIGSTIKLDDEPVSIHAIDESDIYSYKGKPIIIQPKRKLNPYNPLTGNHETYGQKYVMARIEGDKLTVKKKLGVTAWIIGLVILGIIGYAFIAGG